MRADCDTVDRMLTDPKAPRARRGTDGAREALRKGARATCRGLGRRTRARVAREILPAEPAGEANNATVTKHPVAVFDY
jgi:hypothetical protein